MLHKLWGTPMEVPPMALPIVLSSNSTVDYDQLLHARFCAYTKSNPNSIALVYGGEKQQQCTYAELDVLSDRVAYNILAKCRFQQGTIKETDIVITMYLRFILDEVVGLVVEKSLYFVACMLGVLKSGKAFYLQPRNVPPKNIKRITI